MVLGRTYSNLSTAESWNDRYLRDEHWADAPLAFIVRCVAEGRGRRALDLACGTGRHALLLASRGWRVTAVDWSSVALARLAGRVDSTVQADLEDGEFTIEPGAWDLICVTNFLHRPLIPAIRAGMRPGGLVLAAFPMEDERPGIRPMNPAYLLRRGELAGWFADFEIVHSAEVEDSPASRRRAELAGYSAASLRA